MDRSIVIKKKGCGVSWQNDIHRSLFHNEAGSLPFVIVIRMWYIWWLRKMLHSLTCTSSPNMNTWSNCRSEVKINEMRSSNFCTSGFQKYAHVLNKPIRSYYLKYVGTRGQFYWIYDIWARDKRAAIWAQRQKSAATKEHHDKRAPRQKSAATKERRDKIAWDK
jgi:hypothetical protein